MIHFKNDITHSNLVNKFRWHRRKCFIEIVNDVENKQNHTVYKVILKSDSIKRSNNER